MIKNIIFDLDGTLINTNRDYFNKLFFKKIYMRFEKEGYNGKFFCDIVEDCVAKMLKNDGIDSNETVFINNFIDKTNMDENKAKEIFNKFYNNDYAELITCIQKIHEANEVVSILKDKGYNLILATNPLFPKKAVEKRAGWGDIDCSNFSYITSYENSSYCKPNINYYYEIIKKNNLKVEETMMIGNDLIEDLAIEKTGISCYIILDNVLNISNIDNCTKKGNYNDLLKYVSDFPKIKG